MAAGVGCIAVRPASWQHDREILQFLRRRVFVEEQGVPEAEEWDSADEGAWHVLATVGKRDAVGTGRLEPCGKIGRVAVLKSFRGRGVGEAIMVRLVNQATVSGFEAVYLHAQTAAAEFYRRLGFRAEGPVFGEAGIPHVRMRLEIERSDGR
jgi:predicted GNAT family N-acyltransferase